jgi:hypothetical protein
MKAAPAAIAISNITEEVEAQKATNASIYAKYRNALWRRMHYQRFK